MNRNKVALGLSGGVDSAVSAYLLKKQDFDVSCVYLNCFDSDIPGCRGDQDRKDALAVAMHLGLPFQVLDFRKAYQAAVIGYFKREYLAGRTPNPDVVCNRDIKFGLFLDWCIKNGFEYLATGHYAKLDGRGWKIEDGGGRWKMEDGNNKTDRSIFDHLFSTTTLHPLSSTVNLIQPKDLHKDQTYFLWAVPKEKFSRVLFPLGDLLKTEVREIARKTGLPVAEKKDSTGICFIGEVRVEDFLKQLGVKEKIGEVVVRVCQFQNTQNTRIAGKPDSQKLRKPEILNPILRHSGSPTLRSSEFSEFSEHIHSDSVYRVIGRHRGVWFYTIGQRHGFSVTAWPSRHPERPRRGGRVEGSSPAKRDDLDIASLDSSTRRRLLARNDGVVTDRPPLYVIDKDLKNNRLIVGFGAETYRSQFTVSQVNWLAEFSIFPAERDPRRSRDNFQFSIFVRIRHGGELIGCTLAAKRQPLNAKIIQSRLSVSDYRFTVALGTPQRGIAPGQSAVFYLKDGTVLGGGVIQ